MALNTKNSFDLALALARISGHIEGTIKYDDSIPNKTKLRIMQSLICEIEKVDPDSEWISNWKIIADDLASKI